MDRKTAIIAALRKFIAQRPGLEFGNYGDVANYRAELRTITRDLHEARTLLRAIELSSVDIDTLQHAFRAYSGRLSLFINEDASVRLEYCTGQYWPTEYRKAVCAVCAAALWDHYRDDFAAAAKPGQSPGDAIRSQFKREYGRSIANRWFN